MSATALDDTTDISSGTAREIRAMVRADFDLMSVGVSYAVACAAANKRVMAAVGRIVADEIASIREDYAPEKPARLPGM